MAKKQNTKNRAYHISLRVSRHEKTLIDRAIAKSSRKRSEYLRNAVLRRAMEELGETW